MNKHVQHQTRFIRYTMKYISILDLFYTVNVNIIFYEVWLKTSGLKTSLVQSSVSPIHCSEDDMKTATDILSSALKEFPCTYLGLPLTIHKPTKNDLLFDKVDHYLPGRKVSLLNRSGCLIMVKVVLTAVRQYPSIS